MRALLLTPEVRKRIRKLVKYAKEHPNYAALVMEGKLGPPGDDPRHVVKIPVGYRCVFTIDVDGERRFRHLSVSVPSQGAGPNPVAVSELAVLFGFTGSLENKDWGLHLEGDCIVNVTQEVE